nr:MAG TPA: hypothetical protein [Caudoviricetes sp.]
MKALFYSYQFVFFTPKLPSLVIWAFFCTKICLFNLLLV